ncbi:esterase/lipase family protein [Legionella dresdenensis]|uniref:Esterase/lipase family protein n=1 Tax=Legionella dresdenensis TaxID=450200 RepID=A0ABV8CBZ7_9GAMM
MYSSLKKTAGRVKMTAVGLGHARFWASLGGELEYINSAHSEQSGKKIGIFCVHGTADRAYGLGPIARRLIEKGLPKTVSKIHLVSFEGRGAGHGIEFFAAQLIQQIKDAGYTEVYLLGHSRGGLVCSYAAEYLAQEHNIRVHAIFNLASPYGGSDLAFEFLAWFSTSVEQMQPGSEFLCELTKKVLVSSVKYYFFEAGEDGIVRKGLAYIAEYVKHNPDSLIKLEKHTHLSIVSSHDLVTIICSMVDGSYKRPVEQTPQPIFALNLF